MARLTVTEEWIREKLQLHHQALADVRTLCLPGGIEGKICNLGISLKNFERLRTLDLSYNALVSVSGLEHLLKLERLSLYFNKLSAFREVFTLSKLKSLRELDLRLNPLTKIHPEYQLHLIHSLHQLRRLDNCPVGEREKKSALMHFSGVESEPKPKCKYIMSLSNQRGIDRRMAAVNRLARSLSLRMGCGQVPDQPHKSLSLTNTHKDPWPSTKEEISDEVIYLVNDFNTDSFPHIQDQVRPDIQRLDDCKDSSKQPNVQPCSKDSLTNTGPQGLANSKPRVTFADCKIPGSHSIHPLPATRDKRPSLLRIPAEAVFTPNPTIPPSPAEEEVVMGSTTTQQPSPASTLDVRDLSPHKQSSSCQWADNRTMPETAVMGGMRQKGSYREALELLFSMVREHWTAGKTYPQHYKILFTRAMQVLSFLEKELVSSEQEAQALSAQVEAHEDQLAGEVEKLTLQLGEANSTIERLSEQLQGVLEENVSLQQQLIVLQQGLLAPPAPNQTPAAAPLHEAHSTSRRYIHL